MTNEQMEQIMLKYIKGLSKETFLEVIDFIQFLKFKKHHNLKEGDLSEQLSTLDSVETTHLEQEFEDYKNKYPRE